MRKKKKIKMTGKKKRNRKRWCTGKKEEKCKINKSGEFMEGTQPLRRRIGGYLINM